MFNKTQVVAIIAASILGGMAIGYNGAKTKFMELLIKNTEPKKEES